MPSLRVLKVSCALSICGFGLTALAGEPSATEPGQGVWQEHEYSFQFLGFTTTYSCDGLASKLKVLLIAAGARADAKSTPDGCVGGYGSPDTFPRANLKFYTLAPIGNGGNASPPINGVWHSVVIADRSPREVAPGDCELIEQFRDKVLPMFATRNIDNRMTCVPNQLSGSVINLKFEVFRWVAAGEEEVMCRDGKARRQRPGRAFSPTYVSPRLFRRQFARHATRASRQVPVGM